MICLYILYIRYIYMINKNKIVTVALFKNDVKKLNKMKESPYEGVKFVVRRILNKERESNGTKS